MGIKAKLTISAGLRIFAGLIAYRLPTAAEQEVQCAALIKGTVAYGRLIETKNNQPIEAEERAS